MPSIPARLHITPEPRRAAPPAPFPIVLADANPWVRREIAQHLTRLLGSNGVREARSPADVLTLIADPHYRVLVIDPCMPTLGQSDGMPLLRRICCLRPDLRVLVLSRQPVHLVRDKAMPAQIEHVHAKTISPASLWRFIRAALPGIEGPMLAADTANRSG